MHRYAAELVRLNRPGKLCAIAELPLLSSYRTTPPLIDCFGRNWRDRRRPLALTRFAPRRLCLRFARSRLWRGLLAGIFNVGAQRRHQIDPVVRTLGRSLPKGLTFLLLVQKVLQRCFVVIFKF
jgi:hypothetical protein